MELDTRIYGLKDKVAIVTGGGAGIGRGIVREFAKAGASVVTAEINPETGEDAMNEVRSMSGKSLNVVADVRENDQVENVVRRTLEEFGTIDILVNNVGGLLGFTRPLREVQIWEADEELWDGLIRVNTKPTFLCTRAVAKVMIDQKKSGSIINLASLGAFVPGPSIATASYGLAKAGIVNYTMTAANNLGKYGIRVNAIAPGRIDTQLGDQLYKNNPSVKEAQTKLIPIGRRGKPEDIARVAVFLASDASAYVTGHTIVVSGGLTHLFVY